MAAQDQEEQDVAVEQVEPISPAAPELEAVASAEPASPAQLAPVQAAPAEAAPPPAAFDPGKVDGRTLRRTGREPFATRIKPEAHEALRRIAYHRRITIAEALEMAVEAFDRR
ncbi:hypothetical protein [Methylobacterium sp. E-046]|uniref:hypothetical protein n=1 Tax=Methylobacterium sp. E-046 TaxID=2836576 RepID=UPI001FBA14F4|nr:hypothetical protein [Methylobacterium sp. E-046]MCJ2099252.1 hypothetical protein [Methylobacterium sp. E-046]